jgi:hypothetical protein
MIANRNVLQILKLQRPGVARRLFGAVVGVGVLFGSALVSPASATTALGDPAARGTASATGGLAAVEAEVKAGEVTVGATAQVVVRFRNDSSKEVKIGQVNLYPSSTVTADVGLNECSSQPMASGAECAIVVSVKALKTGNWRVEMLVRHDGKTRIVTAAMTGTVAAGQEDSDKLLSDVETIPSEVDFGTLSSSRPLVKSVVMRNVTSIPINIKNVNVHSSDQSGYVLNSDCSKLDVGQACVATITWSPVAKGQSDGVLTIEHDGPTKVASVNLKGSYDPEATEKADMFPEAVPGLGLLISSQEEMDFGTVDNEASMTVSLVNVGDSDMQISDISLSGTENGLQVAETGCQPGSVLEPIEACPLTISWVPVREGDILDDIRIRHTGARGVLVIPVRGNSKAAVNKDTKPVVVVDGIEAKPVDRTQALEGFVITSHSPKKAIINGPGGSRVVTDNQSMVLGGVDWTVDITSTGIDFVSGKNTVRLPFDRSLSSVNRTSSQSSSSSSSSSTGETTTDAASTATTTSE